MGQDIDGITETAQSALSKRSIHLLILNNPALQGGGQKSSENARATYRELMHQTNVQCGIMVTTLAVTGLLWIAIALWGQRQSSREASPD